MDWTPRRHGLPVRWRAAPDQFITDMHNKHTLETSKRRRRGPVKPPMDLSEPGRLWIENLRYYFNCSRQHIYDMQARGALPHPDGTDGRRPFWYTATIRREFPQLLDQERA